MTIETIDISQTVWARQAHAADTLSARPRPSNFNKGFLFFATNDRGGTLYRSNGKRWVQIAASVTAPTTTGASGTIAPGSITFEMIADGVRIPADAGT